MKDAKTRKPDLTRPAREQLREARRLAAEKARREAAEDRDARYGVDPDEDAPIVSRRGTGTIIIWRPSY